MRLYNKETFYIIAFLIAFCISYSKVSAETTDVSPFDYGLLDARTGIERYNCLYKAHCAALEAGVNVSYRGIDSLQIEIPRNAKSIPLTEDNNFSGLVLIVRNDAKTHFVFEMVQESEVISVKSDLLESGDFSKISCLNNRKVILHIEDKNPWVRKRQGYEYGATRKDILYLENGFAKNSTVSSYNNGSSIPLVRYFYASNITKQISNITFIRDDRNTRRAYLCNLINQSGLKLSHVRCETPPSSIYYDYLIRLENCANVYFEDIVINGTYSTLNKSGYGISMDNVYNVTFDHLIANANWGIFGNNNVNRVLLKNCDINRFDVHCYGKDITFEKCKFRDLFNQFSSIYGTVIFKQCEFFDFTPVLFEPSYNAYTKFDLIFKKCIIHATRKKNYLISAGNLRGEKTGGRLELSKQEYPDLYIDGLKIYMPDNTDVYYLYKFRKHLLRSTVDKVPDVKRMKGIKFIAKNGKKLKLVDPASWMVAMELGILTIAGSGVLFSSIAASFFSKKDRNRNYS